jgi:hypothetical protein
MSKERKINTEDKTRAQDRPKRVPVQRKKLLNAKEREGFTRRFVNEEYGAVDAMIENGWSLVSGDENASDARVQNGSQTASVVRIVVNRDPNARARTAVLMEIPTDIYDEYQQYKQDNIDEIEKSYDPAKFSNKGDGTYGSMTKTYK